MSRKLLAFLLSELRTVRVICKNPACGAVVELPIERLGVKMHDARCRVCDTALIHLRKPDDNPLVAFALAVERLQSNGERVDLEFVLPDTGE